MSTDNPTPIERYWLCPLYFFDYDGEEVNLPEGLKITKIQREFVDYLDRNYPDTLPTILSEAKWVIAVKIQQVNITGLNPYALSRIGFDQDEITISQVFDLITALRLYKKGRIVAGLLASATFHDSEWSVGRGTIWTPVSNIIFFKEEPIYELRQQDTSELNALFLEIRKSRKTGILTSRMISTSTVMDVALERFHSAYHGNIEDRLIDQMIAFEALYIKNEWRIKNKLSLRVASILGDNQPLRNQIFNNMKEYYQERSDIVHALSEVTRDKLREITIPNVQEYLRQSIRNFLKLLLLGYSFSVIQDKIKELASIDDYIFRSGKLIP